MEKKANEFKESKKDSNEKQNLIKLIMGLPKELKPKFIALKKISDQRDELEMQMQKEIEELDKKYDKIYEPIQNKRAEVISGIRDPILEVSSYLKDYELEPDKKDTKEESEGKIDVESLKGSKGIPEFWLKAMLNNKNIAKSIKEIDKPILKYLIDIKSESTENSGFILKFIFAKNEYFNNETLVKTFIMDKNNSEDLNEAIGTEIIWSDGKNITIKKTVKKQKNTKTNKTRKIEKVVDVDCFFQFFKTRIVPSEEKQKEMDEEEVQKQIDEIEDDLDLGGEISEKLIPHALNYYCGIADEDEDEDLNESDDLSEDLSDDNKVETKKNQNKKNIEWIPKAKESKKEEAFKPLFDMKPANTTLFKIDDNSKAEYNAEQKAPISLFGQKLEQQVLFKEEIKKDIDTKAIEKQEPSLFGQPIPPQAKISFEKEKQNPIIDKALINQIPPEIKDSVSINKCKEEQNIEKKIDDLNAEDKGNKDQTGKSTIEKEEHKEITQSMKEGNKEVKLEQKEISTKPDEEKQIKTSTEMNNHGLSESNQSKDLLNKAPLEDTKIELKLIKESNLEPQKESKSNNCGNLNVNEDMKKEPECKESTYQKSEEKEEIKKDLIFESNIIPDKIDKPQEVKQEKNSNVQSNSPLENNLKIENEQKLIIESKGNDIQNVPPAKEPSLEDFEKDESKQKEVKKEIKCGAQ